MTTPSANTTSLTRQITIEAPAATVFKYLIDPDLMCTWMGQACVFEPFEGGEYRCEINENIVAGGKVLEVVQDEKIVYTFGWEGGENPVTVGSSRVEITLEESGGSTLVNLFHSELVAAVEEHGGGWDHYLARLAIAAAGGDAGPDPVANPPADA
ncbi:SRPBCC family protein [Candidatus Lucifugimonas marina]|uniref:Transcriptional regulator n=1 Tax=Candidatus Lucifugimonas marina TaxID=3038979 RepID=A0AAJ5ZHR5_9CHLR|nr:transcriptional regulator [SAR202 cluster bacterium JH702]MDG0868503.1 transcriptional regulator [SAR202 cluster bacterium JH639]WFG35136.1 transcriptional regulator [SAR202 cluster bacterium JH545]WFG39092.1 transcriptional regulator [SAR202 cluster bacterium JH1073]